MRKIYAQIGSPRIGVVMMDPHDAIVMIEQKIKSGQFFVMEAMTASHISAQLFIKTEEMYDKTTEIIPVCLINSERQKNQVFYLIQKTDKTFNYFGQEWWKIPRDHFNRVIAVNLTAPIFAGNIATQLFAPSTEKERNEIIDSFLTMCKLFVSSKDS